MSTSCYCVGDMNCETRYLILLRLLVTNQVCNVFNGEIVLIEYCLC